MPPLSCNSSTISSYSLQQGSPTVKRRWLVCQSNLTAVLGENHLVQSGLCLQFSGCAKRFRPPYAGTPPYSDRLKSEYRLTQTAIYRDTALLRPPYIRTPPYSDRLISEHRITQTALYRDTALLRPPCIGTPPYSDRLIGGPPLYILYAGPYNRTCAVADVSVACPPDETPQPLEW